MDEPDRRCLHVQNRSKLRQATVVVDNHRVRIPRGRTVVIGPVKVNRYVVSGDVDISVVEVPRG